jgi:DNA-binding response OmpR family regulator
MTTMNDNIWRDPVPTPPAAEAGALRVLHVDADAASATMLAALLVPEHQVTCVQTLAAAADAVARERYTLLVLDPDLPDGDGVALFEALRASGAPTPVLLYASRHTVWRDQASAFLLKPWTSPRQLSNTALRLLRGTPAMWVEQA